MEEDVNFQRKYDDSNCNLSGSHYVLLDFLVFNLIFPKR